MKVLVCGGRDFENWNQLRKALNALHEASSISAIIEGDYAGADRLASAWARKHGVCNIKVPAHWTQMGRKAGPVRNGWMIDLCNPDRVVAFPGGPGTTDMIRRAEAANILVERVGW